MRSRQNRPATSYRRLITRALARCCAIAALATLVIVPTAPKPRAGAFGQLQGMAGSAGSVPPASPPACEEGCGGSSDGNSGSSNNNSGGGGGLFNLFDNIIKNAQEQAAKDAQARREEAHRQNEQGVAAFKRGDYAEALRLFRLAGENNSADPVIQKNIKNAEAQVARIERDKKAAAAKRLEEAAFHKYASQFAALLPVLKSKASRFLHLYEQAVPPSGFTSAQWLEYSQAKREAARLEAKLNRDNVLSDADATAFFTALQRRNALWAQAMAKPHDATARAWLMLPVSVVDGKVHQVVSDAVRKASLSNETATETDPFALSTTARLKEAALQSYQHLEDKVIDAKSKVEHLGSLVGIGHVDVPHTDDNVPDDAVKGVNFVLGRIPKPVGDRAETARKGGNVVSKVTYRAWNHFREEVSKITGVPYDAKASASELDRDMNDKQKTVKGFVQWGK